LAANRHLIREAVVQTIFECEFRKIDITTKILGKNLAEITLQSFDRGFAEVLFLTIKENFSTICSLIKELAPEWPWEKIAILDRAILITGLAELNFLPEDFEEIPPIVTLDEFVEIAKDYGGDSSRRLVNGVLNSAQKKD
jgi:transcription antitermination protein NusB